MFKRTGRDDIRRAADRIAAQAPERVHVVFDRTLAATVLWDYGEDRLSDVVLAMPEGDFERVQRVAATFNDPAYPLPVARRSISNGQVIALAVVMCEEGLRPLARSRRRPGKDRPPHLVQLD